MIFIGYVWSIRSVDYAMGDNLCFHSLCSPTPPSFCIFPSQTNDSLNAFGDPGVLPWVYYEWYYTQIYRRYLWSLVQRVDSIVVWFPLRNLSFHFKVQLYAGWPLSSHYQIPWLPGVFQTFEVIIYAESTIATVAIQNEMHVISHCNTHIYCHNYDNCMCSSVESNEIIHYSSPPSLEVGRLESSLGERGLWRSPSRNRIWCILALKYDIWWQQFQWFSWEPIDQISCMQEKFSLTFPIFPDFSLITLKFPDFSRFSRWVATLYNMYFPQN